MSDSLRKSVIEIDWKINNDNLARANEETDRMIERAGKTEQSYSRTNTAINKSSDSLRKHNSGIRETSDSVKTYGDTANSSFQKATNSADKSKRNYNEVNQATRDARQSAKELGESSKSSFEKVSTSAGTAKSSTEQVKRATDEVDTSVKKLGTSFKDGMDKSNDGVKNTTRSVRGQDTVIKDATVSATNFGSKAVTSFDKSNNAARSAKEGIGGVDSAIQSADASVGGLGGKLRTTMNSAKGNVSNLSGSFGGLESNVSSVSGKISKSIENGISKPLNVAKGLLVGLAATAGIAGVGGLVNSGIDRLSAIEDAKLSLNVMLQDEDKTTKFMDEVMTFAKTTPYAFQDLATNSKNLLAYGMDIDKIVPTMKAIGDLSAASGKGGEGINTLSAAFGKMQVLGKVSMEQLNTITEAGVPALKILANEYGISVEEMQKKISSGSVESGKAIDVLVKGIEEGSDGIAGQTTKLGGIMSELKNTWKGSLDSMKSAVTSTMATLIEPAKPHVQKGMAWFGDQFKKLPEFVEKTGKELEPAFQFGKKAFTSAKDFVLNDVIPTAKTLIGTMGPGFLDGAITAFGALGWAVENVLKPPMLWLKDYAEEHPGRMEAFAKAATIGVLGLMAYSKVSGVIAGATTLVGGLVRMIAKIGPTAVVSSAEASGALGGVGATAAIPATKVSMLSKVKGFGGKATQGAKNTGNWLFRGGAANATVATPQMLNAGSLGTKGALTFGSSLAGGAKNVGSFAKTAGKSIPGLSYLFAAANLIGTNKKNVGNKVGGSAGMLAGGGAGAALGASLGSVVPGIGTAIGGALGGIIGTMAGTKFGTTVGEAIQNNWKSWTSSVNAFADKHPILGSPIKWTEEYLKNLKSAAKKTKTFFTEAYESAKEIFKDPFKINLKDDLVKDDVSKKTAKAIDDYMKKDYDIESGRKRAEFTGVAQTEEEFNASVSARDGQKDTIVGALNKKKEASGKNVGILQSAGVIDESVATSAKNTADELNRIRVKNAEKTNEEIKRLEKANYEEQSSAAKKYEDRINEIKKTAKEEGKALTKEQLAEIERLEGLSAEEVKSIAEKNNAEIARLEQQQKENAVTALSSSAQEQEIILGRLADNTETLSAKQAGDIIKNSLSAKDGAIKSANEKYDEVIKAAEEEYYVHGTISKAQFEEIKTNAENQRDSAITSAEEMHEGVVTQAQAQATGQLNQVDWATGNSLTKWDRFVLDVAGVWNTITGGINTVMKALGVDTQIGSWNPKGSSSGATVSKPRAMSGNLEMNYAGNQSFSGGHALVGEEGFELAYDKASSTARILGANGPEVTALSSGSKILNHRDSVKVMSGGLGNGTVLPGFAKGTSGIGDFVSNAVEGTKNLGSKAIESAKNIGGKAMDLASGAWDWVSNPAEKLKELIEKHNPFSENSPNNMIKVGAGAIKTLGGGAKDWVTEKVSGLFNFSGTGSSEQVNAWVKQAIGIAGVPATWAGPLATIAMKESNGNPTAQNNWDINAKNGIPSKGLMQTIEPTFNAYKKSGYNNILNPVDNILASIGYIQSRYGNVFNVPGIKAMASGKAYKGYEKGGRPPLNETVLVGESGPELVEMDRPGTVNSYDQTKKLLNNNQQQKTSQNIEFNPQITINVTGGDSNVADQVSKAVEEKMNAMFETFRRQFGPGVVY